MNTLTHDFTGDYDYPAEEAGEVVRYFESMLDSGEDLMHLQNMVIRERKHWQRVFGNSEQGAADMKRFAEVFNAALEKRLNVSL